MSDKVTDKHKKMGDTTGKIPVLIDKKTKLTVYVDPNIPVDIEYLREIYKINKYK